MEIVDLQRLAGIIPASSQTVDSGGMNMSLTGTEKAELMRKHNIRPGDANWFKLWFSKPYLTNERPI